MNRSTQVTRLLSKAVKKCGNTPSPVSERLLVFACDHDPFRRQSYNGSVFHYARLSANPVARKVQIAPLCTRGTELPRHRPSELPHTTQPLKPPFSSEAERSRNFLLFSQACLQNSSHTFEARSKWLLRLSRTLCRRTSSRAMPTAKRPISRKSIMARHDLTWLVVRPCCVVLCSGAFKFAVTP